jgi:hypothetical protein
MGIKIINEDVDDTASIHIKIGGRTHFSQIGRFHNDSKTTPMYYKQPRNIIQWLKDKLCDFIWSGDHEFYLLETKTDWNLYRCRTCGMLKYQSTHKVEPLKSILIDGEEHEIKPISITPNKKKKLPILGMFTS